MKRLLPLLLVAYVLSGPCPPRASAQDASSDAWEAGVQVLRVASHGRASIEVGGHVSRLFGEHWSGRASLRHAFFSASAPAGFGVRYDRRRIGGSVSLAWRPVQFHTGPIGHSFGLRAGPVVEAHWAARARVVICATGLSEDPDDYVERRYPKHRRHAGVGARFGLEYGLTYGAVTARFVVAAQKIRGLSSGRTVPSPPATGSLGAGMNVSLRF